MYLPIPMYLLGPYVHNDWEESCIFASALSAMSKNHAQLTMCGARKFSNLRAVTTQSIIPRFQIFAHPTT